MQNEKRRLPDDQKFKNLTRLEFVLTLAKTGQRHFTVVYSFAKPLISSKAEGDLVAIETSI